MSAASQPPVSAFEARPRVTGGRLMTLALARISRQVDNATQSQGVRMKGSALPVSSGAPARLLVPAFLAVRRPMIKAATLLALAGCADEAPTAPGSDLLSMKPSAEVLSDTDPCTGGRVSSAAEVVFPSPEYRTLQSAVCAVTANGTIRVLEGTHEARITIWGKHVNIRGAGNEKEPTGWPVLRAAVPSEVVAARTAEGVITVGAGGSLSVTMLRV